MNIIPTLLKEMAQEAAITRKMLACIPDDKYDWQPHPKSMTIQRLAGHIAELPLWVTMTLTTNELDFAANPYTQETIKDTKHLLEIFERSLTNGREQLEKATEELLLENWTLRTGEMVHGVFTKLEVVRMTYNQITHHRAQLGVFLRLLHVPIPGTYGPSADEMGM